jgi:hypothetical protein
VTTADITSAGHRSAVKIVGSIAAVGAAAAVAGLGTLGTFTDSTTPVDTTVDAGVVSIDVSAPAGAGAVPFAGGLMVAGDSRTYRVDLVNDGNAALSGITLTTGVQESSVLDSDPTKGLQLTVESCSQAWEDAGSVPTCAGTLRTFYSGRIVVSGQPLTGAASLSAGAVDHLLLTARLPHAASGSAFEGAKSSLNFVFTGTQRGGTAR